MGMLYHRHNVEMEEVKKPLPADEVKEEKTDAAPKKRGKKAADK